MKWLLALLVTSVVTAETVSKVTIPVEEYIRLRETSELPSLTIIENVAISGDYGKTLKLTVSGAGAGKPVLAPFLEMSRGSLHDCKGNAVIKREAGQLAILPLGNRFQLSCSLTFLNWNEATLTFLNTLYVKADVTGAETILGGEGERQSITLTRVSPVIEDDRAEITATARYRVSVVPEQTSFDYTLQFSNPSRNKRTFSVPKLNGELIQSVSAEGDYTDAQNEITFTLLPGNNQIQMKGRFNAKEFKAPIKTMQSFLLVENSPMLQLSLETKARRLSAQDAGMYSQYTSHRAYLLGASDSVTWTSKKLEVFTSTGFSLTSANYTYYVPKKGKGVVEAVFEINNQGTPEIPLKVPGKVLFVEIGGAPQVLYRDPAGNLLLQVPMGTQTVLIQYEGAGQTGMISSELAKPDAVVSNASVKLQLAPDWDLLSGKALDQWRTDLEFTNFLWSIAGGLFFFWFLGNAGLPRTHAFLGGLTFTLVDCFLPGAIELLFIGSVIVFIWKNRTKIKTYWPQSFFGKATVVVGSLVFLFVFFRGVDQFSESVRHKSDNSVPMMAASLEGARSLKGKAMDSAVDESEYFADAPGGTGAAAPMENQGTDYQGLPARIRVPNEGRFIYFSQGLLSEKAPAGVQFILLGRWVRTLLLLLALLGLGVVLYRHRTQIRDYILADFN